MKCVAGCTHFTGGEIRHHKDCPYYKESLSEMMDNLKRELAEARAEIDHLRNPPCTCPRCMGSDPYAQEPPAPADEEGNSKDEKEGGKP